MKKKREGYTFFNNFFGFKKSKKEENIALSG
jgi:hypothetical protein